MKVLLIFDQGVNLEKLKRKIEAIKPSRICLFSLTADWQLLRKIESLCTLNNSTKIEIVESARLIDNEVNILRQRIAKWAAELSEEKINGKSIKEWFILPKSEVSTWWFSLLSERNPLKTETFFNIAQLGVIDRILSFQKFDLCIYSLCCSNLLVTIKTLCQKYSITILRISQLKRRATFKQHIKAYLENSSIFNFILKPWVRIRINILHAVMAKLTMGPIKERQRGWGETILFVSYFPYIDRELAEKGQLKNKYAFSLQEKLSQMKKKIIWIWMYVSLDEYSFRDTLNLAVKFRENGEANFFLDEFMSLKLLIRSLLLWLRQVKTFVVLNKRISNRILYEGLSIPEAALLIRNLMFESFAGWTGLEGILFFELFKELFSCFSAPSHCIYYFEMHAWEKALNAAKQLKAANIKTIAYQHTSISQNEFQYFCYPSDFVRTINSQSLPLPDILACNGNFSLNFMASNGYPSIRKVENIRHLYLAPALSNPAYPPKDKIVLISGSFNREETTALISLCYEAFANPKGFKVWLKGHPTLPLEEILEELKIHCGASGYEIKHEPISELIKTVSVVLVGSSSVALEALALGCKVISLVIPNCMFLSPLIGFDKFYTKVYNPQEVRQIIRKIIDGEEKGIDRRDIIDFISTYWCLDTSLQRWEEVLR